MEHTNTACQACGNPGVKMYDVCPDCKWEQDTEVDGDDGEFIDLPLKRVGPEHRGFTGHSYSNGMSIAAWMNAHDPT